VRIYRLVWLLMCTALATTGLLTGLAVSPSALGTVAIAALITGAVVAFATWCVIEPKPDITGAAFALRGAAITALTTAAAFGLAVAVGWDFFPVALWVVLSAPALVGRYFRWLASAPRPSAAQFGAVMSAAAWASPGYVPVGPAGTPTGSGTATEPTGPNRPSARLWRLTDAELCERWRASCIHLPSQPSMIAHLGAVDERRELLAEIERRNPAGFLTWVTSEPRPVTLRAHLSATLIRRPQVDWDKLLP
jgi:hypothetical protein